MAWEELLRLHDTREDDAQLSEGGEARDARSLIRRVSELAGQPDGAESAAPEDGGASPVYCADGYLRRSPVQPYHTAEGYESRRTRRIVLAALGVCLAALLAYALIRAGIFRFR